MKLSQLEDFEAFLEKDFNSYKFSNDLLLATNDRDVTELDIDTSIKKLTFEIDEVEKRMTNISSQNYESLVSNFSDIENTNQLMTERITPLIERVNTSFQKIQSEIIKPYDEAQKMNSALRKVHTTLDLLRGSNFFLLLVLQVEDLEKSVQDDDKKKDLVKLAKLYKQINELYDTEKSSKEQMQVSLSSVKLVRDYQSIHARKNHQLVETCVETITNEFSHSSSFKPENTKLQHHLIAYYILRSASFVDTVEKATISKQVNVISNQLSRSLQSPRNFLVAIKEVKLDSNEFLEKLTKILLSCEVYQDDSTVSLYQVMQKQTHKTLEQIYWPKLILNFKKNIASTMARGGPIAKNLRTYSTGIRSSVKETFDSPEESEQCKLFTEAIELIVSK